MVGLPTGAIKLVIQGNINGTQDWSTGFWIAGEVNEATLDVPQISGQVGDLVQTWCNVVRAFWDASTRCTGVAAYYYPAGSTVATRQGQNDFGPIGGTGAGTHRLPTFCSLVQTLRTLSVGRSFRGRMYVPITDLALAALGQVGPTEVGNIAVATRDMLSDVNDLDMTANGVTGQKVVVASFTKGLATPVNQVYVDSLMDVQHRREDKIGASFSVQEFIV